jgi:hypothetical protein
VIVGLRVFEGGLTVKIFKGRSEWREMEGARCNNTKFCLRRTSSVQVLAVGAGAQIDEAAATSATDIISSHCSEDNFYEGRIAPCICRRKK